MVEAVTDENRLPKEIEATLAKVKSERAAMLEEKEQLERNMMAIEKRLEELERTICATDGALQMLTHILPIAQQQQVKPQASKEGI